jgi:hypothetical protein
MLVATLVGPVGARVAFAGNGSGNGNGRVNQVAAMNGSHVALITTEVYVPGPACATTGRFALDLDTSGGRAAYSTALAAQLNGGTIVAYGTGTCNLWGDSEDAQYLWHDR